MSTESMTAAVLTRTGAPLELQRLARPRPAEGWVLVELRAAGVCHTDLHLCDAVPERPPMPLVLGHEMAGVVAESRDGEWRTGERVGIYYYDGCGACAWCARGEENLCPVPRAKWGFDTDGGYAQFVAVPGRCLVRVPDGFSLSQAAAVGCAGTTAVHAVGGVAGVRPGETVAVIGVGGVGSACLQVAKVYGARTIALDPRPEARELALHLGADAVFDGADGGARRLRGGSSGEEGCAVVIDTVGGEATVDTAVALAIRGGRVVLIGYTGAPSSVNLVSVITREIMLLGSVGATRADAQAAMDLAARGLLRPTIAREFELHRANEALDLLRSSSVTGRLVLVP
jgi:2-desacetyl-2-hydroxyethyl bacteriochlorophyllide A dehydrogenase